MGLTSANRSRTTNFPKGTEFKSAWNKNLNYCQLKVKHLYVGKLTPHVFLINKILLDVNHQTISILWLV